MGNAGSAREAKNGPRGVPPSGGYLIDGALRVRRRARRHRQGGGCGRARRTGSPESVGIAGRGCGVYPSEYQDIQQGGEAKEETQSCQGAAATQKGEKGRSMRFLEGGGGC